MIDVTTVHTTGVNWDSIITLLSAIVAIFAVFSGIIVRAIRKSIRAQVLDVVTAEIKPILTEIQNQLKRHDTRIARLEGVEEGKKYAIAAAGVTTTDKT